MRTAAAAAIARASGIALVSLGSFVAPSAGAEPGRPTPPAKTPVASVGSPNDGALVGGVPLVPRPELRLRWPSGPRWALPGLVSMLERAAVRVERRFPGSVLLVGDLSRREGGSLEGHTSHESGRDADVAFYYIDPNGRSVRTDRLLKVAPSGAVASAAALRFDAARNWALVEAFLTDPEVRVQRIFVADAVKRLLLEYARTRKTSSAVVARAETAMKQPTIGQPHDDHFHVRIACPRGPRGVCVPEPGGAQATGTTRTAALGDAVRSR